jgi:hypothetical protein
VVTEDDPELELWDDEELLDELEEESSDDALLPEDPLGEEPLSAVLVVDEPFDAFVVVAAELEPRLPVAAITPKASAKVASAAAVIRRRIILMRWARAARRWRTRSGLEAGGGVEGMPAS